MSTYNIELAEKVTFLSFVEFAKQYVSWKTVAVSVTEVDDDDNVLTGKELKDISMLRDFINKETSGCISLYEMLDVLYVSARYMPHSEGQAKRIVLAALNE